MIGTTVSHYKILEKLGEGGMGVVYKAHDTKLDRHVALKFLPPELTRDPEAKQRFIHEAKAASALQHSNICVVYDIDETSEGELFICMEHLDGETVKKKNEQGLISIDEAVGVAIQIAQGLSRAHEAGIVHRDVKPANIMVTSRGETKIVDFGLAKLSGRTVLTRTGSTVGTASYMSPEQARGENVDRRTDIWSLGVVLYEMLAGKRPFESEYEQALVYAILNQNPRPIREIRPEVPEAIEKICRRSMAKDVKDRYQTAAELISDLESYKAGTELSRQTRKLPGKKRGAVYAGLAVIGLAALIALVYFQFLRPPVAGAQNSIAVLPFEDISPQHDQEFFCDGITEELIGRLSRISTLKVPARTSVFTFKGKGEDIREIGSKLGVTTVLEGSVRKAGNRLRIAAQLINVPDGYHLWSETYDRDLKEVFAIQDEISSAIVEALRIRLTSTESKRVMGRPTADEQAYEDYLKGQFHFHQLTPGSLDNAFDYFQRALKQDSSYALAYAGIALVWAGRTQTGLVPHSVAGPLASAAARKAAQLDSSLAEVQYALACIKAWHEWDWEGADQAFRQSIQINPNFPDARAFYAHVLDNLGRPQEGRVQIERAITLDPLNPLFLGLYGLHLIYERRYDEAIAVVHNALRMAPDHPTLLYNLPLALQLKGMYGDAVEAWKICAVATGDRELEAALMRGYREGGYRAAMLRAAETVGARPGAKDLYPEMVGAYYVYAGRADSAFEWLKAGIKARDPNMPYILWPDFDSVKNDPRYMLIVNQMNLRRNPE